MRVAVTVLDALQGALLLAATAVLVGILVVGARIASAVSEVVSGVAQRWGRWY